MEINLDEILGGAENQRHYSLREPSEVSYQTKPRNNHIILTSESFSEEGNTSKQSLLYLDDNIFQMESPEDQASFSVRSMMGDKSETSIKSVYSKLPGERLFYQSKALELRRQLEIEERLEEERKKCEEYFVPKINEQSKMLKSKYLPEKYDPKELNKVKAIRKNQYEKKVSDKMESEINQCTFKPAINKKKIEQLTKTRSTPAFEHLYHASKIQQLKKQNKILEQELEIASRFDTRPKQQVDRAFDNFLERNEEFKQKQRGKLELLQSKFHTYDVDGQKLFTPKISNKKEVWKTPSGMSSATGSTPRKESPSLKDMNQMLLNRLRKVQPSSEPFEEIAEEREQEKQQYD